MVSVSFCDQNAEWSPEYETLYTSKKTVEKQHSCVTYQPHGNLPDLSPDLKVMMWQYCKNKDRKEKWKSRVGNKIWFNGTYIKVETMVGTFWSWNLAQPNSSGYLFVYDLLCSAKARKVVFIAVFLKSKLYSCPQSGLKHVHQGQSWDYKSNHVSTTDYKFFELSHHQRNTLNSQN